MTPFRCLNAKEIRFASILIAGLELIWAWIVYFEGRGRLSFFLQIYDAREEFAALMVLCALMIVAGCLWPCRKLRHWGLWTTALISFAIFWFMFYLEIYGLMFATLPWVGLMALVIYFMDSVRKPREKMDR